MFGDKNMKDTPYSESRYITKEYFDDIKTRAKLILKDGSVYDEIMDEKIEKIVKGTVSRFFTDRNEAEDAMQEIKLENYRRITEYLASPACNSKENLEAWIVKGAKWKCLNMLRKKTDGIEYRDELTGEDISDCYEGIDGAAFEKYVEYIWNINTEPPKNIFFILSRIVEPETEVEYGISETAAKYAPVKMSPTRDGEGFFDEVMTAVKSEKTAFSDAVNGIDTVLFENGFEKPKREHCRKIVTKLNEVKDGGKMGDKSFAEIVTESKQGKLDLSYDENGALKIDENLLSAAAEYISKGNNRVKKALEKIAPNGYGKGGRQ